MFSDARQLNILRSTLYGVILRPVGLKVGPTSLFSHRKRAIESQSVTGPRCEGVDHKLDRVLMTSQVRSSRGGSIQR